MLFRSDIEEIYKGVTRVGTPITLTHRNVPNGIYDDVKSKTRFFVYNEFAYYIISKLWIDSGGERLDGWMKEPWGTYQQLP